MLSGQNPNNEAVNQANLSNPVVHINPALLEEILILKELNSRALNPVISQMESLHMKSNTAPDSNQAHDVKEESITIQKKDDGMGSQSQPSEKDKSKNSKQSDDTYLRSVFLNNYQETKDQPANSASTQSLKQHLLSNVSENSANIALNNVESKNTEYNENRFIGCIDQVFGAPSQHCAAKAKIWKKYFCKLFYKLDLTIEVIVPLMMIAFVSRDLYEYTHYPETRFGSKAYEVAFGLAFDNPVYWGSTLFSIKQGSSLFITPITALTSLGLAEKAIKFISKYKCNKQEKKEDKSFSEMNRKEKAKTIFHWGAFTYGWFNYLKFLFDKNIKLINYLIEKNTCEMQNKAYGYLFNLVNYGCTFCNDWEFVYPPNSTSAQKCLDALLRQNMPAGEMSQKLSRIASAEKGEEKITRIDLSKQKWLELKPEDAQGLFDKLAQAITGRLEEFIYTHPSQQALVDNVRYLADLIKKANPKRLIINNQKLDDANSLIFSAINQINVESISYQNNGITTGLGQNLIAALPNSTQTVVLGDNQLGNGVFPGLIETIRRSNISGVNLATNRFTAVSQLFTNIEVKNPIDIDISNNPITVEDAESIKKALQSNKVKHLGLANCGLDNEKLWIISDGFDSSSLTSLDLSENPFNSDGVYGVAKWPPKLKRLILFKNKEIDETGHIDIFTRFRETEIEHLAVGDQVLSGNAYGALVQLVRSRPTLQTLEVPNTGLDDGKIDVVCEHFPQESYLNKLVVSRNPYSEKGFNKLIETFKRKANALEAFDNIDVDMLSVLQKNANSTIAEVKAVGSKVNPLTASKFISQLPGSSYRSLSIDNTAWGDQQQNELTQTLTHPSIPIDELNQVEMSSITEKKLNASTSATNLTLFSATNTRVTNSSIIPAMNVLAASRIPTENFILDGIENIRWTKTTLDDGLIHLTLALSGLMSMLILLKFGKFCWEKIPSNRCGLFRVREQNILNLPSDAPESSRSINP